MLVWDLMNHRIDRTILPIGLPGLVPDWVRFDPIGAMLVLRRHRFSMLGEHRVTVPVWMLVLRVGFSIVYVVFVVVIDCVLEGVV